jgi:cytoplasmic iron level regulating protein YaaA (DUF328/UPF0246 family)
MIIVISPSKTLDFSADTRYTQAYSEPDFLNESKKLVKQLAAMAEDEIADLMKVSEKLAALNYERFQSFSTPFQPDNAKQALLSFKGDVYLGFELDQYEKEDFDFAQDHLRILSGLYGLLRPLDLIQPYRLEMGTRLQNERGKDLYAFWGERITQALNQEFASADVPVLVNLASNEYFKSVQPKKLEGKVITPAFKEVREGKLRTIAIFAKKARGMMSNFAIRHRITDPEDLKHFREEGYTFQPEHSSESEWVFTRE